jgi:hypothetical protein
MPEPVPPADVIARAVVQLAHGVEQTNELLVAAIDLHRRVVDLHASLTESLVDLERLLADDRKTDAGGTG